MIYIYIVIIYNVHQGGILLMKRKNGEGTWGVKTIKGIQYKYFRNSDGKYFYGKTEKEIKEKINKYEKTNSNLNSDKSYLGDFMREWLFNVKRPQIKQRTFDNYEIYYNMFFVNYTRYTVNDVQLCVLDSKVLTKFFNSLAKTYSMSSIKKAQTLLTQCINYAVDEELIEVNPMKKVKMPSQDNVVKKQKEVPFLSYDDMERLYNESNRIQEVGFNLNGNVGDLLYGNNAKIIILIMYTGLRMSEALGLKWSDIDFDNKCIYINRNLSSVKNRNEKEDSKYKYIETTLKKESSKRTVPLCDRAYEVLDYLYKHNKKHSDDDYVCLNKDGKIANQRNITRTLNSMLIRGKCEVKKCGMHTLRHSFGSYLVSQNVNIAVVSKLMGHKDVSTTYNIYIHVLQQQQVEAINMFNKKEGD